MKTKELCRVISQEMISPDIYSLWIETKQIAAQAKPGQFVALYSADKSRMPFACIHEGTSPSGI